MADFTGLITLTQVSDGENGNLYRIVSDVNTITRIGYGTIKEGQLGINFSPFSLRFKLLNAQGKNCGSSDFLPTIYLLLSDQDDWKKVNITNEEKDLKALSFEDDYYVCNLLQLFNFMLDGDEIINDSIISSRQKNTIGIRVEFIIEETIYEKTYSIQTGYLDSLATFSLGAEGIVGAYRDQKLEFNGKGLTIYNGGFRIKSQGNTDDEAVFSVNEDGDLFVKGHIEALDGKIGNILLQDGALVGEGYLISNEKIVANNIVLQNGAFIEDFIKLGGSYLYNPDRHGGVVLNSGNINIREDNKIKIGNILIFGGDNNSQAYIQGGSQEGSYWKINNDGTAYFKDIYADQVYLQNTVLEIGSVQSVGSTMIFKDSAIVKQISYIEETSVCRIILDKEISLLQGDWIVINEKSFEVIRGSDSSGSFWFEVNDSENYIQLGQIITKFGQPNKDLILSARGAALSNSHNDYGWGNSIVLSDFAIIDNSLSFTKRLVLGQLDGLEPNISGIGLYADNVFLKGAITTEVPKNENGLATYAGINTLSTIKDCQFADSSNIVFWAGAKGILEINKAPFFVTDQGNLYAQNAKIENSLFTGTIEASIITTAKIIGNGAGENTSSLIIEDTAGGISFKESETGIETLKITGRGLESQNKKIIETKDQLILNIDKINFNGIGSVNILQTEDGLFQLNSSQNLEINIPKTSVKGSFNISYDGYKMEYQKAGNGFDLFVGIIEDTRRRKN